MPSLTTNGSNPLNDQFVLSAQAADAADVESQGQAVNADSPEEPWSEERDTLLPNGGPQQNAASRNGLFEKYTVAKRHERLTAYDGLVCFTRRFFFSVARAQARAQMLQQLEERGCRSQNLYSSPREELVMTPL
ncbi:hypothetical protein NDU88_005028 [Pleurodeles waltl]|uniref:Uncharacterized protein n=1 Tax=Pleurodeles waltl TaxID=8319 RepID=A0AAV7MI86_PLEWA|nr:hypothetical protein NDU88_005028 [Pleurodeles waltl]